MATCTGRNIRVLGVTHSLGRAFHAVAAEPGGSGLRHHARQRAAAVAAAARGASSRGRCRWRQRNAIVGWPGKRGLMTRQQIFPPSLDR